MTSACTLMKCCNHKGLECVIVLWTANTERFCDVRDGLNDTADNLLASVKEGNKEAWHFPFLI